MNQLTISGKAWEPKIQYSPNGVCITEFSVSVYDGKDRDGKAKYFNMNCKAFKELAENIGNEIKKQDNVLVTGRMTVETWDKDGVKQYKNVLMVDEIGKTISRFSGQQGQQQANNNAKVGYDVSSFGTEVFPEEEIQF